jgi:uncharacterized protein (TIGR03085 family)
MTSRHWSAAGPSGKPAAQERAALAALLADLGPDAPTLCEGWRTSELAAHLVTREGRASALPGIVVPALHDHTAKLEAETLRAVPYERLVRTVEAGPPLGRTLLGLPGLVGTVNLHEFFVHHEDVRRAQPGWEAREVPDALVEGLWRRLVVLAPVLYAGVHGVRLTLTAPDGRTRTVGRGKDEVTLRGPVPELFLYSFGRRTAAEVTVQGSVAGQAKLAAANLSQ